MFSQIWKTWMDPGRVGESMVEWKLRISKKTLCSFELSIQSGEQVLLRESGMEERHFGLLIGCFHFQMSVFSVS